MPVLRTVQNRIGDVEGFRVRFRDRLTGRDVHDNKKGIPQYLFRRMAKNRWTVARWKRERFARQYAGYDVEVIYQDGETCGGTAHLSTVRDTYLE